MKSYQHPVLATPADIDGLGHVNNVVYVRWMQEAATAHWDSVASPELRAAVSWVVTRHEVDYKAPAFAGEQLVVRTWVGEPSGATWERFLEIHRPGDGKLLAKGRSVYAAIDPATGRPRRVDRTLQDPFGPP